MKTNVGGIDRFLREPGGHWHCRLMGLVGPGAFGYGIVGLVPPLHLAGHQHL